jgi:hypothetical protein
LLSETVATYLYWYRTVAQMAVATSSISFGAPKAGPASAAEIHNQVTMMLGHEAFDPELSRRVLVDHAFIVAGGEITKQARNWIGNKLDASKRSQVMFMDRDEILNLLISPTYRCEKMRCIKRGCATHIGIEDAHGAAIIGLYSGR